MITTLLVLTSVELVMRVFWPSWKSIEIWVFVGELLLIGLGMTYATITLVRLMNRVFGAEFVDEKHHLKITLIVFMSTYTVHSLFYLTVQQCMTIYDKMWAENAFMTECIFILC